MERLGTEMHNLCRRLFPICRSITGEGFRRSLEMLREYLPDLQVYEVPTGTKCFDWEVPREWNVKDAYIIAPDGSMFCEFSNSNLHVVGYSIAKDVTISLEELQNHLYSLPEQPDAIPYVTSYYKENWGFCISDRQRSSLLPGNYRVYIDSELKDGSLTYAEILIPGRRREEIFLSTYLCHPSMANNELSGPVVTTYLVKWLLGLENREYSYRVVIVPETIGSIAYLSKNLEYLRSHVIAGFNITCIGDERAYSYLPSRQENSLADQVAKHVLKHEHPDYIAYGFLDRGSDERQYCSPGVDLPVCSIMRSKYAAYPEYHTSLDNLKLVTAQGLYGGYNTLKKAIACLEMNKTLKAVLPCEPQLGKRGLYPTVSTKGSSELVKDMMNFLAYCDGEHSNLEIAEKINIPLWSLQDTIDKLLDAGVVTVAH